MSRKTNRAPLMCTVEEKEKLLHLARSKTFPAREVDRAKILWEYLNNNSITSIQHELNISRVSIYKCIDKALAFGVDAALKDMYHRPKGPIITDNAKAWVVHIACTKPKDFGYAAEVWSRKALANHIRENAELSGHPCLKTAAKATVHRILKQNTLRPEKIKYYLEKRDPEFENKMIHVLMIYRDVAYQNEHPEQSQTTITVSVDEKPGIQAIALTTPDLLPVPNKHRTIARDYEYKRMGTLSLLAALDLHTGHITAVVEPRHRSQEFIMLLKSLDDYYPSDMVIRIILDNHSSHISKETRAYLATRPNRFKYVHTPKHGSWLNIVETLFGKMSRTFLKHIRISSLDELKDRILKGIAEINADPVVHRWKKFDTLDNLAAIDA